MRLQLVVVALWIALAGIFTVLNPSLVLESRPVQLPGLRVTVPVLEAVMLAASVALTLLLFLDIVTSFARRRVRRSLEQRLAQRDQEISLVKSGAYDRVPELLESLRRELLVRIDAQGHASREELSSQIATLRRLLEAGRGWDGDGSVGLRRDELDRPAAA